MSMRAARRWGVAEQIAAVMRSAQPEFERIALAAVGNAMRRGRLA